MRSLQRLYFANSKLLRRCEVVIHACKQRETRRAPPQPNGTYMTAPKGRTSQNDVSTHDPILQEHEVQTAPAHSLESSIPRGDGALKYVSLPSSHRNKFTHSSWVR